MIRQHHKNARACSPRFVALAALLGGTVLACAMAAQQESATADAADRATNPPATSHPSDRHMSDVIRQYLAETTHTVQAEDEPVPGLRRLSGNLDLMDAWFTPTRMADMNLPDHLSHMPALDPSEVSEYLSIQPMPNWPTAYTRNALMLHGHDQLGVLARPYEHPNSGELANRPFLISFSPVDLDLTDWHQFIDSPPDHAPVPSAP